MNLNPESFSALELSVCNALHAHRGNLPETGDYLSILPWPAQPDLPRDGVPVVINESAINQADVARLRQLMDLLHSTQGFLAGPGLACALLPGMIWLRWDYDEATREWFQEGDSIEHMRQGTHRQN